MWRHELRDVHLVELDPRGAVRRQLFADRLRIQRDGDAILLEPESLTTHENCLNSARLLEERAQGQRVLLVTSAMHMPRALASCRSAGLDAVAAVTDVGVVDRGGHGAIRLLPESESLDGSSRAIREWVARIVYRLQGHID